MEEQISATLSNIQLSRGVDEITELEGDFTEEDVEHLEDVLDGCDNEYKNLFATLDQLGSCLDEVRRSRLCHSMVNLVIDSGWSPVSFPMDYGSDTKTAVIISFLTNIFIDQLSGGESERYA